jgi:2-methylfumaryl-CoA hydratase
VSKARQGNFFEDFKLGQVIVHATPRTVTAGDVALYTALYGPRFAVQSSDEFAKAIGYPQARSTISSFFIRFSARPCRTFR